MRESEREGEWKILSIFTFQSITHRWKHKIGKQLVVNMGKSYEIIFLSLSRSQKFLYFPFLPLHLINISFLRASVKDPFSHNSNKKNYLREEKQLRKKKLYENCESLTNIKKKSHEFFNEFFLKCQMQF